jgi:hypothetical protein
VLLRELRSKEACLEVSLEVRAHRPGWSQRVALRYARLALAFATFNGIFGCGAQRMVRSIATILVGS